MTLKKEGMAQGLQKNKTTNDNKQTIRERSEYSAYELYNYNTIEIPKLLSPFLQTVGLASLVGTSDSGKSTFLRQLSISIVLNLDNFLGYKINNKHKRVIYVSTEDDSNSVSYSLRKQIDYIKENDEQINLELLKNLEFIFETDNLHKNLEKKLKKDPVDLIIIDAFSDIFTGEINANTKVRQFLNIYDRMAKQNNCLIIFLHHIGKRTTNFNPSKDSIIGSQAFEAKMRVVLELRPNPKNEEEKYLWVLKSNFLEAKYKNKSYILKFTKQLTFENSDIRGSKNINSKSSDQEIIKKVLELSANGNSSRKIEEALKNTPHQISKSSAALIIKENNQSKSSSN